MKYSLSYLILVLLVPTLTIAEVPRIGFVVPLTGKAAQAGEAVRNGASLANESINGAFELIFEDNSLDNTRTMGAVRKLVGTDNVKALVVYASGPSNAAAPIVESLKLPMIGMSVDPNVSRSRQWVMIHWASNESVAEVLLAELSRRNLRKVAVVTTQVQGNLDLERVFLEKAKARKCDIVYNEQLLPTEVEFASTIGKMKTSNPEAVFLDLYYGQAGGFARQSAALGFRPQFFGHFVLDDASEIAAANGALNGAFFANTSAGDLSFDNQYIDRFGKRPILGAIGGYDIVRILAQAYANTDGTSTAVNGYLHRISDFDGKIGRYSALPSNSFDVPAGLGEIRESLIQKVSSTYHAR